MGLVGGGAAGAVLLAMLPLMAAGVTRQPETPPAIAALAPWVPEARKPRVAASKTSPVPTVDIEAFDVTIDRTAGGIAPFGLRLVGPSDLAGMRIVLRDMPSGVVPLHGEMRDPSQWSLPARDLERLRLKLAHEVPHAFRVRIDVLTPSGDVAARSLARVRVVDVPEPDPEVPAPVEAAVAEPPAPPAHVAEAAPPPASERAHARHGASVTSREKTPPRVARHAPSPPAPKLPAVAAAPVETAAADAAERHWPEGASGLGAIARPSERQMWWKLPPPSWSPFKDTATSR